MEEQVVVAVGSYDSSVACLTFNGKETGHLERKWRCSSHSASVRAIATDGQWLATGSTDETIRLYNLRDFTEIGTLAYHEGSINWLEFSGNQLYCASDDGGISVWQTKSWTQVRDLKGHKGPVSCIAVHPSGKTALSVGRDKILRTWDLSIGVAIFRQKLKEVAQLVKWSSSGSYYALSYRLKVEVYNIKTGDLVSSYESTHSITCFTFISDEELAIATEEPSLQLTSITKSTPSTISLSGITQRIKDLAVLPEKNILFSASSDGSVRVWKMGQALTGADCIGVCSVGTRLNCLALGPLHIDKSYGINDGPRRRHRNFRTTTTAVEDRDEKSERNCTAPAGPRARRRRIFPCLCGSTSRMPQSVLSRLRPFSYFPRNSVVIRQYKNSRRKSKVHV